MSAERLTSSLTPLGRPSGDLGTTKIVSNDASNGTTICSITSGTGGNQTFTPTVNASGRYVRLYGTQRGTGYGYSLSEFRVHNAP